MAKAFCIGFLLIILLMAFAPAPSAPPVNGAGDSCIRGE